MRRRCVLPDKSERADVRGLRALLALRDLELDPLVLVQAAVAGSLDCGEGGEDVCAAVVRGDEPEALVRVEPLHNAGNHARLLDGRSFPTIMVGNEVVRPALRGTRVAVLIARTGNTRVTTKSAWGRIPTGAPEYLGTKLTTHRSVARGRR